MPQRNWLWLRNQRTEVLLSAKCLKCKIYTPTPAKGKSHRAAPLTLLAKSSQLYLLCPCQRAVHRERFDKKAQQGLMCLFQSYCQCKQLLPFKRSWRECKRTSLLIRISTKLNETFYVKLCWTMKISSTFSLIKGWNMIELQLGTVPSINHWL